DERRWQGGRVELDGALVVECRRQRERMVADLERAAGLVHERDRERAGAAGDAAGDVALEERAGVADLAGGARTLFGEGARAVEVDRSLVDQSRAVDEFHLAEPLADGCAGGDRSAVEHQRVEAGRADGEVVHGHDGLAGPAVSAAAPDEALVESEVAGPVHGRVALLERRVERGGGGYGEGA